MNLATFLSALSLLAAPTPSGRIETVAGTGQPGYSGDGGPATAARLNEPFHCDLDGHGHLYIADALNHCIRKVDLATGTITTVAGCGKKGYTGDGGPARQATMNEPYAVVVDSGDNLYIVDRLNAVVRRVDGKSGHIETIAGGGQKERMRPDGSKATDVRLIEPNDCCLDGKGGLLIADVAAWRVYRVDLHTGILTTFAGTPRTRVRLDFRRLGNGGPATKAILVGPRGVCVDGHGNTYICEREANEIRKVDAQGIITTIAGTTKPGNSGDGGDAKQAAFNGPKGIRCDKDGNIYVVDTENNTIRRIDARTNIIVTIAGGQRGSGGDGGDATKAGLDRPHGCVVDAHGAVYIADTLNHRVRKVAP
jgi:sugar lactone lactonase YvrE